MSAAVQSVTRVRPPVGSFSLVAGLFAMTVALGCSGGPTHGGGASTSDGGAGGAGGSKNVDGSITSSGGSSGSHTGGSSGAGTGGDDQSGGSGGDGGDGGDGAGRGGTGGSGTGGRRGRGRDAGSSTGGSTGGDSGTGGTSGNDSTGGTSSAACDAAGLVWKTGSKSNFISYPDPGSEECIKYSGCDYEGQFEGCDGTKPKAWVMSHNIVSFFPNFAQYKLHDLCLKSGSKSIVVTVYDTCADSDCDGCCTQNKGSADALIDIESYTNDRWGVEDGRIQWADLGPTKGGGCN